MLERQRHPKHAYRACLGLLSLAKRFLQKSSEATCPRGWFIRNTVPLSYTARSDDVTSGSVTFAAGNSGHDAAIAPVTFAGTSITICRNQRSRSSGIPSYRLTIWGRTNLPWLIDRVQCAHAGRSKKKRPVYSWALFTLIA